MAVRTDFRRCWALVLTLALGAIGGGWAASRSLGEDPVKPADSAARQDGAAGRASEAGQESATGPDDATGKSKKDEHRVSVAVARDRAKLMHQIYSISLDVIHDRYFHGEKAIVPARAMEDVFGEMSRQSRVKARWISVNTKPMSINHEPKTDLEKQAAAELTTGKEEFELIDVERGYYHRAAPIPLGNECVNCHTNFFGAPPKTPRFAGLVISIPIDKQLPPAQK